MNKYFIITVDTEGDNLWNYRSGDCITTSNSRYIPRFQELCEKYGFPPVYLTNYEMLCDDFYVSYVKEKYVHNLCEVGLHLHAWNNPPVFNLNAVYTGNPYLIEYPDNIMHAKFDYIYKFFIEKMGFKPTSHRSGRWAMDNRYFKLLEDYDIKVDCSVTPHIDWSNNKGATCGGSDYSKFDENVHWQGRILEIPPTIRVSHRPIEGSLKHKIKVLLCGEVLNLRLATASLGQLKYLIDLVSKENSVDYLELMLHSSELMPGGSPYFKDDNSIEEMFSNMETLFAYIHSLGYKGITLTDYFKKEN